MNKKGVLPQKLAPGWTEVTGVRLFCNGCGIRTFSDESVVYKYEPGKKTTAYCQMCATSRKLRE